MSGHLLLEWSSNNCREGGNIGGGLRTVRIVVGRTWWWRTCTRRSCRGGRLRSRELARQASAGVRLEVGLTHTLGRTAGDPALVGGRSGRHVLVWSWFGKCRRQRAAGPLI